MNKTIKNIAVRIYAKIFRLDFKCMFSTRRGIEIHEGVAGVKDGIGEICEVKMPRGKIGLYKAYACWYASHPTNKGDQHANWTFKFHGFKK